MAAGFLYLRCLSNVISLHLQAELEVHSRTGRVDCNTSGFLIPPLWK